MNYTKFTAKKAFTNRLELSEADFNYLMNEFHFFLNKDTHVQTSTNSRIVLSFKTRKKRDEVAFESLNFLFAKKNEGHISTIHRLR